MVYPLPAVLVTCGSTPEEYNVFTAAWTGTICSDPAMCYVSIRPERFSHAIVTRNMEFTINLTTRHLARATDWCGVRSGRDFDKWAECGLTPAPAATLGLAPAIEESPVSIECRVHDVLELGSHHLFLADVTAVQVEEGLLDARGRLDLARAGLTAYSHSEYFELGRRIGSFEYSVRKDRPRQAPRRGGGGGRSR